MSNPVLPSVRQISYEVGLSPFGGSGTASSESRVSAPPAERADDVGGQSAVGRR